MSIHFRMYGTACVQEMCRTTALKLGWMKTVCDKIEGKVSDMSKILVAYFSASGETAKLAKTVAEVTGGDLFEIEPEQRYAAADLNWNDEHSRSSVEMNDESSRPAIVSRVENMEQYDTVFVGFPIWWYQAPRIIETFLESYDFSGKTVIPFATSGGSGMGNTAELLKASCPGAAVNTGKRMSSRENAASVRKWVESLHI